MKINYRYVMGNMVLVFAMLPLWSVADTLPDQQNVEQSRQVGAGSELAMPAWVAPPVGPYRFFPPQAAEYMMQPAQPDAGQFGMAPDPSAGYPDDQNALYPPAGYPPSEYPSGTQAPLPTPNNGYAYEYQNRYQPPAAGMYGYDRTMQPPVRTYDYGNYPRRYYPADMRPDYYPYGPIEQMPQPYYR